jgi:hypothetical protein
MKTHMGTDQYGETYHDLGEHPRKKLMEILGYTTAEKMYIDRNSGGSRHCGWIIGPHWVTVFEVTPINLKEESAKVPGS